MHACVCARAHMRASVCVFVCVLVCTQGQVCTCVHVFVRLWLVDIGIYACHVYFTKEVYVCALIFAG